MKNWKYIDGAKIGNALKYTNLEDAKKMCRQINDSLAPDAALRHYRNVYEKDGAYYVMETGEATAKGMKRVGNSHVGNAYTEADMKRLYELARKRNKTASEWAEFDELNRREEQASKELIKKLGKNKTGNDTPAEYFSKKPKVIGNEKTGAEGFFKQLSDDVKEREKKDDEDIEKVGNREIYVNQSEQTKAVVYEDGTIMLWDKNGNNYKTIKVGSLEEARKKLNSDYKKVGNKTYKVKESSGHDGGYDYGYIVVDESNRSVGRTFSTRSEAEEYIKDLYKKEKVGNSKTGNSAQDDKFAYVMREFDEGKLKTPDGKVVTDPAQAKAIAYSESKKTENGLARARNAIKKS